MAQHKNRLFWSGLDACKRKNSTLTGRQKPEHRKEASVPASIVYAALIVSHFVFSSKDYSKGRLHNSRLLCKT
jgi:hypothetical protein